MNGLNLEEDDRAVGWIFFSGGDEHMLPHRDGRVRVGDRGVVRVYVDGRSGSVQIDRDWVAIDLGGDAKIAEDLGGKRPHFDVAVLQAEDSSGKAGHGKRVLRLHGLMNDERPIGQRKLGDRLKRRLCCCGREKNKWRKKDTESEGTTTP